MSEKLGFTFYPKDWWTSDTFFEFSEIERYYYLECLFLMYSNDGYMKTQKTQIENRLRTQISNEVWDKITSKFIEAENGFTHPSVNKRLKKTLSNRENGKLGGRPPKEEKPKKPKTETQKNPPLESEREKEIESEREENHLFIDDDKIYSIYDFLQSNFRLQVINWQKLIPHANFKLACEVFLLENAFKSYTTDHFRSAFNKFWKDMDRGNKQKLNGSANHEWIYAKGSQECYKYQLIDGKQVNTSPATLQEYLNYKNELRTA